MKNEAREIDQIVRDWWLKGPGDGALVSKLLDRALPANPTSLVPYARAHEILEREELRPLIRNRVNELGGRLKELTVRERQIDDLGDLDNDPEVLFHILGEELAALEGFDPALLRSARLPHLESRAAAARALLDSLGWDRLPADAAAALKLATDDLADREYYEAWGLFVDRASGKGLALGLKVAVVDSPKQELWAEADQEMVQQAGIALGEALKDQGWQARIEWPASYVGESLGLPLYIAGLIAKNDLPRHALTASTGRVDIGGTVTAVNGIKEKIEAARRLGIRRVLVPYDNLPQAKAAAQGELIVVPITHLSQVHAALRQSVSSLELGYAGLIRLIRASVKDYQLMIEDEAKNPNGFRLVVANTAGKVSIWIHENGRVRADGPPGTTLDAATRLILERVPPDPEQRDTLSFELPLPLHDAYQASLRDGGFIDEPAGIYEKWRMRLARGRSRATVVLYKSSKCVIQGTAPAWDNAHDASQQVTHSIGGLPPRRGSSSGPAPQSVEGDEDSEPHIGTDEAGKGDYFGPLVSAAVYVDRESAAALRRLGVRDSKRLSDRRVKDLAKEIKRLNEGRYAVTPINPRRFNELWEELRRERKNLNSLLAWGHTRSIKKLLSAPASRGIQARYVLADQFADRQYIEERIRGAGIPIHQRHKAETDIAVAAASILARDGFLQWLERWSGLTQISLPKGASPQVINAAKQYVRRWGTKWLGDVAKLSFRTTQQVLEGEESNADSPPPPWTNEAAEASREG